MPSPELAAIVRRWLRSYASGDKEAVVNLFSDDASLGYIGTSHDEIWRDDTLRRGMPSYMDDIPNFTLNRDDFRSFECGEFGWVECNTDVSVDNGNEVTVRSTFILHLEKGMWKIVHVHNSSPVSNMQSMGYESRGIEDLLDAALAAPTNLPNTGIATIMFTDIADSTVIAETIGDTRWSIEVKSHLETVNGIVAEHLGVVVKSLGDGTMSSFPSARAALLAAKALQHAVEQTASEPRLRIRIGLHTGDLIEQDGDMFGTVVNKAARIASVAHPGEIRLSDATKIMVGSSELSFDSPVMVPLKGLDGEHALFRLEWKA